MFLEDDIKKSYDPVMLNANGCYMVQVVVLWRQEREIPLGQTGGPATKPRTEQTFGFKVIKAS